MSRVGWARPRIGARRSAMAREVGKCILAMGIRVTVCIYVRR